MAVYLLTDTADAKRDMKGIIASQVKQLLCFLLFTVELLITDRDTIMSPDINATYHYSNQAITLKDDKKEREKTAC